MALILLHLKWLRRNLKIEIDCDEDSEYFTIKKFNGFYDDREVKYRFEKYYEVDKDVWEDYLEKYNLSKEYNKGLFKF